MFIKATAQWSDGVKTEEVFHKESERIVWQSELNESCKKKGWRTPEYIIEREDRPFTLEEATAKAISVVLGVIPTENATDKARQLIEDIINEYTEGTPAKTERHVMMIEYLEKYTEKTQIPRVALFDGRDLTERQACDILDLDGMMEHPQLVTMTKEQYKNIFRSLCPSEGGIVSHG